jgi:hypothetical protein
MALGWRVLAVAVLAAGPVALGTTPAAADSSFQGQTTATAVHVTVTQQPASSIVTASLVDDAIAYAASSFDSSVGSEGQAASLFPGNLVVQGPGLLCSELFPCPVAPPSYPLLADASYPRSTNAQADANQSSLGSGPFVVTPASATAHAEANANSGSTSAGRMSLLTGTPVAVTIDASTAATTLATTADTLTVHVESSVTGVTVGGLLHIGSIRTTDDITLRPGSRPVDQPRVVIADVTVAGQSASIDDRGIHIAGQNGPALGQRLAQLGLAVRTIGTSKADTASAARSDATGVEVDFTVPVSGIPYIPNPLPPPFDVIPGVNANGTYVGQLTLGAAGAAGAAEVAPSFDLGGFPLPPAGSAVAPGAPTSVGNPDLLHQLAVAAPAAPVVAPQRAPLRVLLDAFSVSDLYAALAVGTVVMFLGWRLVNHPVWRH